MEIRLARLLQQAVEERRQVIDVVILRRAHDRQRPPRDLRRPPQLIDTSRMDSRQRRYNELLVFAMPLIFAFSIGVSFISPQAAELSWLLVFLVRPVLLRITHYSGSYDAS